MRWLSKRMRDERGATAVFVGILMIPLLGFAAISLDVGALYSERAQLQNGADAAALAIALECAEDNKCDTPNLLASNFANRNANDSVSKVFKLDLRLTAKEVLVTTSTEEIGGASALSHPFARLIGIEASTVGASATAQWGKLVSARTLPLALSICDFQSAIPKPPSTTGPLVLIRYDENKKCKPTPSATPIPGGFGWLDRGGRAECEVTVSVGVSVLSEAGNSYPGACDATMTDIAAESVGKDGTIVLIPIYDEALSATGPANSFGLAGIAAFTLTGWKFSGANSMPRVNPAPVGTPQCEGNCRGIQGYFIEWVCQEAACIPGAGTGIGANAVRLMK